VIDKIVEAATAIASSIPRRSANGIIVAQYLRAVRRAAFAETMAAKHRARRGALLAERWGDAAARHKKVAAELLPLVEMIILDEQTAPRPAPASPSIEPPAGYPILLAFGGGDGSDSEIDIDEAGRA